MPHLNNKFSLQFVGSHSHVATQMRTAKTANNWEMRQSQKRKKSHENTDLAGGVPGIRACPKFQN